MDARPLQIARELSDALDKEKGRRIIEGGPLLGHVQVKLLGQFSLFADAEFVRNATLFSTQDCDALIRGDWIAKRLFSEILQRHGLIYDELSAEIWIPEETEWNTVFSGEHLEVLASKPMFTVLSKAVKAPEKNKALIRYASSFYGPKLQELFEKYQVANELWR